MNIFKKLAVFLTIFGMFCNAMQTAEAVTYVTDMGGMAYDESRAATNLAPAIALATVVIVAAVAIGVQNTHGHHRSSSSSNAHHGSSSSSYSYSSSSSSSH